MSETPEPRLERHQSRLSRIFSTRYRTYALLSILFALVLLNFIPGGRIFFRNTVYSLLPASPRELILPADPYENGKTHGSSRSTSIRLLCSFYLKRVVCRNDAKLIEDGGRKALALFELIPGRWTEEISGLSDGSGVDIQTLMLANSFLDIGMWRIGCRQVVLDAGAGHSKPGRLMHAHNLDWDNLGGVGNFMVTIFRTAGDEERLATVRMGFPGMTGALTIINEKGISMGFNQLGFASSEPQMPVFIAIRDIAETCSSFDQAEQRIIEMPPAMPFCIVLADAPSGQAAVYERLQDGNVSKRVMTGGVLAADNTPWHGVGMPQCPTEQVARNYAEDTTSSPELMQTILRDRRVLLHCNIYSVIFDYTKNRFYLAAGKLPAATGNFQEYTLF